MLAGIREPRKGAATLIPYPVVKAPAVDPVSTLKNPLNMAAIVTPTAGLAVALPIIP